MASILAPWRPAHISPLASSPASSQQRSDATTAQKLQLPAFIARDGDSVSSSDDMSNSTTRHPKSRHGHVPYAGVRETTMSGPAGSYAPSTAASVDFLSSPIPSPNPLAVPLPPLPPNAYRSIPRHPAHEHRAPYVPPLRTAHACSPQQSSPTTTSHQRTPTSSPPRRSPSARTPVHAKFAKYTTGPTTGHSPSTQPLLAPMPRDRPLAACDNDPHPKVKEYRVELKKTKGLHILFTEASKRKHARDRIRQAIEAIDFDMIHDTRYTDLMRDENLDQAQLNSSIQELLVMRHLVSTVHGRGGTLLVGYSGSSLQHYEPEPQDGSPETNGKADKAGKGKDRGKGKGKGKAKATRPRSDGEDRPEEPDKPPGEYNYDSEVTRR